MGGRGALLRWEGNVARGGVETICGNGDGEKIEIFFEIYWHFGAKYDIFIVHRYEKANPEKSGDAKPRDLDEIR